VNDPFIGLVSQMASAWHGFDVHLSSKWHSKPVLPGVHWQLKLPIPSMQVAPFKHAAPTQSSMFSVQLSPVHPFTQMQA
jgi:hypothetical protein